MGIDNRMMGDHESSGCLVYDTFWLGSHTLFCLAGEGGEVEKLAAEVWGELIAFAGIMRGPANLLRMEVVEVGDVAVLEESSQHFAVPITVAYGFQQGWRVYPAARPLKSIDLAILQP
jgi:hypothetical protein